MTEIAITFTPDGIGHGLYTEAIRLDRIGRLCVERATTIEFDNAAQYWRVRDRDGLAMFRSRSRKACLTWERQYLEAEEERTHELPNGAGSVAAGA
jgi:hypothetical protein